MAILGNPGFYNLSSGLSHYLSEDLYKELQNCIRDIILVAEYLQQSLDVLLHKSGELALRALGKSIWENTRSAWEKRTYQHISTAFRAVTKAAQPDEPMSSVSNSGHSRQAKATYAPIKIVAPSDESIISIDFSETPGRVTKLAIYPYGTQYSVNHEKTLAITEAVTGKRNNHNLNARIAMQTNADRIRGAPTLLLLRSIETF